MRHSLPGHGLSRIKEDGDGVEVAKWQKPLSWSFRGSHVNVNNSGGGGKKGFLCICCCLFFSARNGENVFGNSI